MTASDAKAYCVGIAELVPVFLIALYVIDNGWVSRIGDEAKSGARSLVEEVLPKTATNLERLTELTQQKLQDAQGKLMTLGDGVAVDQKERATLLGQRDALEKTLESIREVSGRLDVSQKNVAEGLRQRIEKLDASKKKLLRKYATTAIVAIFSGIATEIIALWGSIGLISRLFAIAWGTSMIIAIAGSLSDYAIDRLYREANNKFSRVSSSLWLPLVACISAGTFIWILISVRVQR
jgi:hypothetical protein